MRLDSIVRVMYNPPPVCTDVSTMNTPGVSNSHSFLAGQKPVAVKPAVRVRFSPVALYFAISFVDMLKYSLCMKEIIILLLE